MHHMGIGDCALGYGVHAACAYLVGPEWGIHHMIYYGNYAFYWRYGIDNQTATRNA